MIKGEEMKKMKKKSVKMLKCLAVICLLGLLLVSATACQDSTYNEDRFSVSLSCGYGNNVEINAYAPFYVDVTNLGNNFEGSVQIIVPGRDNQNVMYEKEISIQQGATKRVEMVAFVEMMTKQVNVRIVNDNGKVIWEELQNCTTLSDLKKVNVGILSDDYSALGYMDHQAFSSYTNLTTQIYELKADTLQTDWHAFDMLDVIVISDFSTDLLSDAQINALSLWVNDGGLLMVGTGSTASKTLAKLNGSLFSVTTQGLQTYSTKFGLTIANYDYDYVQNSYYSQYDDYEYEMFFEENYEEMKEVLQEEYLEEFCEYYGYPEDTDTWYSYMEDDFYYYCYYEFYEEYLETVMGYGVGVSSAAAGYPYVKADIMKMFIENEVSGQTFYGEEESGKVYELAYAVPRGDGYILLSGADFTKTPLSNYEGNDDIFIHWVESLIGQKCYEDSQSYSSYSYYSYSYSQYDYDSMDYYQDDFFEGVDSATVPPVLIYIGILFLYVVAILVFYLVMRRKKKTMKLWLIYPIMAIGISILIFCIGFSTRIHRPVLNALTLLRPDGTAITQITYASVTVPRNKEYTIGFNPEQGVEYISESKSYYYDEEETDLSKYAVGYTYGYDSTDISVGNLEAMGSAHFKMRSVDTDSRNVLLAPAVNNLGAVLSSGTPNIEVTNEFGCKLENAAVVCHGKLYYIGDMENGQTVNGYAMKEEELYYSIYSDGLGTGMMQEDSVKSWLGFAFGSINGTYDEYLCRLRALNALSDYCDRSDVIIFLAFPTEEVAGELQGDTNYNERKTEIIFIEMSEDEFLRTGAYQQADN